ncbi:rabgap/tbc domain-containing protein [Anaeramoeba flamelloides]|uniref:Rabgap/tbc domain-containing protein n=1 Tax=Anaeramoeba flamelloides TaxID=1746091 RepID=A0AAV7Z9W3_9EUKA|nr:rabgap/tbc domain-containing protein [Anaeramoeba flamelloides]
MNRNILLFKSNNIVVLNNSKKGIVGSLTVFKSKSNSQIYFEWSRTTDQFDLLKEANNNNNQKKENKNTSNQNKFVVSMLDLSSLTRVHSPRFKIRSCFVFNPKKEFPQLHFPTKTAYSDFIQWGIENKYLKQFIDVNQYKSEINSVHQFNEDDEILFQQMFRSIPKKIKKINKYKKIKKKLNQELLNSLFDSEGRITNYGKLISIIYHNGIEDELRPFVWAYLLGNFPKNSTKNEREELKKKKIIEYNTISTQWKSFSEDQLKNFSRFTGIIKQIEIDILRIDKNINYFSKNLEEGKEIVKNVLLTYAMYNFDIG